MSEPTTGGATQSEQLQSGAAADTPDQKGEVAFQIEGDGPGGRPTGYSVLVSGEVQSSSILSSEPLRETVTLLEDDTKLLSGTVRGGTVGFVLDGDIIAAEFDDPAPSVRLDGTVVDPERWPTVKAYLGDGARQEPVADPFPNSGELGKPCGDPLDPLEAVVVLEADDPDDAGAYCFDLDGDVLAHPDSASVSADGDRVFGYLYPGWSAEIEIRGAVTRIDTADGIDFSVRARD